MEDEACACFPDGIRALLVDDDSRFLKSAMVLLSLCNYKVTTCSSPNSAIKVLADGVREFDVLLSDAHKAASCGFDLRSIVEADLHIPVIYCVSFGSEDMDRVIGTLQGAYYMIQKPLDAEEARNLWRVITWRKCCLDFQADAAVHGKGKAPAIGDYQSSLCQMDMSSDHTDTVVHFKEVKASRRSKCRRSCGAAASETKKHRVLWTPCLQEKFEFSMNHLGLEAVPSQILKHMNVKGLERGHVASHLQKHRARIIKALSGVMDRWESVLPRFDLPNEPLLTEAAGSSNLYPNHLFLMHNPEYQTGQFNSSIAQAMTGEQWPGQAVPPLPPPLLFLEPSVYCPSESSMISLSGEMAQCGGVQPANVAGEINGEGGSAMGPSEDDEFPLEALLELDFSLGGTLQQSTGDAGIAASSSNNDGDDDDNDMAKWILGADDSML